MFTFIQPQTGWHSSPGLDFYATVREIIAHRKQNPRFASQWHTDPESVAAELDYYTCLRIHFDPQFCTNNPTTVSEDVKKKLRILSQPPASQPKSAAVVVARVENAAAGIGVVLDWLGDSLEPVPQELAEARAAVCAECPQNGRPDFIQRLEGWAASGVKELLELKNGMELKTSKDDQLHHCQICDCALKLKVHAKMEHIKAHTGQRVMDLLPAYCWYKTECSA